MDKPLSLRIEETKQTLVNTINSSQLHPYILDSIVKDLYNEIHILYMNQSKQEIEAYNAELMKQKETEEQETND
jgi:hypothetical protein